MPRDPEIFRQEQFNFFIKYGRWENVFLKNGIAMKKIPGKGGEMVSRFHQEPESLCGNSLKKNLPGNLFCLEPGPDFLGKVFSNLTGMHEIRKDFWRDTQIMVNKSGLEFYLQDLGTFIISNRAKNTGLDSLSFQKYHHSLTSALEG